MSIVDDRTIASVKDGYLIKGIQTDGGDTEVFIPANVLQDYVLEGLDEGKLVTTDNTVTLTNKTLTSPKINEDVALARTATQLNRCDLTSAGQAQIHNRAVYGLHTFTTGGAETTQAISTAQVKTALGILTAESIDTTSIPTIVKICIIAAGVHTEDTAATFTYTVATGAFALSGLTAASDYAIYLIGKAKTT